MGMVGSAFESTPWFYACVEPSVAHIGLDRDAGSTALPSPFIVKLRQGADLTGEDEQALVNACTDIRRYGPREDVIVEGERPDHVHVVIEGFACRYKMIPDGGRQIMAWLVPGDFCDLHVAVLGEMDHSIATISASTIGAIPEAAVKKISETSLALTRALWWATLVDEAVLREWLVNMGRRPADRQIAHLFCELLLRLRSVGAAPGDTMDMPLTQVELADTVGLSPVHVNRVIQQLRDMGLISWRGRELAILDEARLRQFAGFDPNYLHLIRRSASAVPAGRLAQSRL